MKSFLFWLWNKNNQGTLVIHSKQLLCVYCVTLQANHHLREKAQRQAQGF